jgi:hypothetical protein
MLRLVPPTGADEQPGKDMVRRVTCLDNGTIFQVFVARWLG